MASDPMTIWVANSFDAEKAAEACRGLARAYDDAAGGAVDAEAVSSALAAAAEAFPGLAEHASSLEAAELDPALMQIDPDGPELADENAELLTATARLAIVGAAAEANHGFDWSLLDGCVEECRSVAADLPSPTAPGFS